MLCLLQNSNGIYTSRDEHLYPIKPLKAVLSPDGAHILTIEQEYTSVEVNTYNTSTHLRRTLVRYPCQPLYIDIKVYKNDCMVRINSWLMHLVEFETCKLTTCVCKRFWKSFTAATNKDIGLFDIYRYPTTHRFQVDAFYKKPQTFKEVLIGIPTHFHRFQDHMVVVNQQNKLFWFSDRALQTIQLPKDQQVTAIHVVTNQVYIATDTCLHILDRDKHFQSVQEIKNAFKILDNGLCITPHGIYNIKEKTFVTEDTVLDAIMDQPMYVQSFK